MAATLTFVGNLVDTTNVTVYTFTAASIGTAAADRIVVLAVSVNSVAGASITSVSVGGTNATQRKFISRTDGTDLCNAAIYTIPVSSGITADIVVTVPDTGGHCSVGVYALTGANEVPVDTASTTAAAGTTNVSVTMNTDIQSGDAVLAVIDCYPGDPAHTWSGGVTEDYEQPYAAENGNGGAASGTASGTSITPTATRSASAQAAMVACAWRSGSSPIAGTSTVTFTLSATGITIAAASGSASPTFSAAGTLLGAGSLAGVSTVTFATAGAILGLVSGSGSVSLVFTTSGGLEQPSGDVWLSPDGLILVFGPQEGKTFPSLISPLSVDLPGKQKYDKPNPFKFRRMK